MSASTTAFQDINQIATFMDHEDGRLFCPDQMKMWYIVNFTEKEYVVYRHSRSRMYIKITDLFKTDQDGYSRWMPEDTIVWCDVGGFRPSQESRIMKSYLNDFFEDVYGAEYYDHKRGEKEHYIYVSQESTRLFYQRRRQYRNAGKI